MAKIRRRSSADGGGYQVRYYGPDGKRRAKTFGKKSSAKAFAAKVEADKVQGEWLDPTLAKTPFKECTANYLDTLVHVKPSTRLKVEGHLRCYVLPTFQHIQVGDIRPSDVRAWISALLAHGLSAATVRAVYGTFSRIVNMAVTDGLITKNPCAGVHLPAEGRGQEMRFLTPDEVNRLVFCLDDRLGRLSIQRPRRDSDGANCAPSQQSTLTSSDVFFSFEGR